MLLLNGNITSKEKNKILSIINAKSGFEILMEVVVWEMAAGTFAGI